MYERTVEEGERRPDRSTVELIATSFIAGFTVTFGTAALGIVEAPVEPGLAHVARVAGALAFGTGVVSLVVGRAGLFSESFFDPAAATTDPPRVARSRSTVRTPPRPLSPPPFCART